MAPGATPWRAACFPLVLPRHSFLVVPDMPGEADESHRLDFACRQTEITFGLVVLRAAMGIVQLHNELPSMIGPNMGQGALSATFGDVPSRALF